MNSPGKEDRFIDSDGKHKEQFPQTLIHLFENPKRLSGQRLWLALEDVEKQVALSSCIVKADGRQSLVDLVASARNFRVKTVAKWDDDKIVEIVKSLSFSNRFAILLLQELQIKQGVMCRDFMDALAIPNENGIATTDRIGENLQPETVHDAADLLLDEYGIRKVVLYFLTLACQRQPLQTHLWTWLKGLKQREEEVTHTEPETIEPDKADPYEIGEGESNPSPLHLTTLDSLVRKAIIDAKTGVVGCLQEDQVHDVVDEFISLNAARPHTYFHSGFRDAMFDLPLGKGIVSDGSRWYWAGVIQGWAHFQSHSRIVEEYDNNPVLRSLGDGADSATDEAVLHVTRALSINGRQGEVSDFIRLEALRRPGSELFQDMLEIGTWLLHQDDPGEARTVFDRLMEAVRSFEKQGYPPAHARFLTVRRRQAHCLRMLLEHDKARGILAELLELDPNPNNQAMVHADLGMLAGNYNRLEDISFPQMEEDLIDFLDRLQEGSDEFRQSIVKDVPYASHGHYCLGVLALGNNRYDVAANHLERARGHFRSGRMSYGDALIGRTDLYLGISQAARAQSAGNLTHATQIMIGALESGETFPTYLIKPTLEGLEIGTSTDDLSKFITAVLKSGKDAALDALSSIETAIAIKEVTVALYDKARALGRCEVAASIMHDCFNGYMKAGRHEDARKILDELENLATEGVGTGAFQELLLSPTNYQPVWDEEDAIVARARCLESSGDLEIALEIVRPLFNRYATRGDLYEAEGILDNIRSYGLPEELYVQETRRLEALMHIDVESKGDSAAKHFKRATGPLKVLFVGGDENQAKLKRGILEILKTRAPHVEVTFIFPGWSGNWSGHLEKVKAELEKHDILVLMRYMRTHLGREIRKACGKKQWRSCWSGGSNGIADSIRAAANAVEA